MQAADRLVIQAPVEERARYLMHAYPDLATNRDKLIQAIEGLRQFQSGDTITGWLALAEAGDFHSLAVALVEAHYDPAYDRARKRDGAEWTERVLETASLDDTALSELADRVCAEETV